MENLVNLLRMLDASDLPDDEDEHVLGTNEHSLVSEIETMASDILISGTGHPHFDLIDELYHDYGYFIFPGDRDQFGWLTGCILTKKGLIVFG
jgi:hypothetical protein